MIISQHYLCNLGTLIILAFIPTSLSASSTYHPSRPFVHPDTLETWEREPEFTESYKEGVPDGEIYDPDAIFRAREMLLKAKEKFGSGGFQHMFELQPDLKATEFARIRPKMPQFGLRELRSYPQHTLGFSYAAWMRLSDFSENFFMQVDRFLSPDHEFGQNRLSLIEGNSPEDWFRRWQRYHHDFFHFVPELGINPKGQSVPTCYEEQLKSVHLKERNIQAQFEEVYMRAFVMGNTKVPYGIHLMQDFLLQAPRKLKSIMSICIFQDETWEIAELMMADAPTMGGTRWSPETVEVVEDHLLGLVRNNPEISKRKLPTLRQFENCLIEAYMRGVKSKSMLFLDWQDYLSMDVQKVKEELNIPLRKCVPRWNYHSYSRTAENSEFQDDFALGN